MGQTVLVKKDKIHPGSLMNVPELLQKTPYNTLAEILRGRMAGLTIHSNGTASMRGANSINVQSEPLVVMDGMAIGPFSTANGRVNIHDIKLIEVLSDGAGWSSIGGGGVILITSLQRK